jgi:hypothetical protein
LEGMLLLRVFPRRQLLCFGSVARQLLTTAVGDQYRCGHAATDSASDSCRARIRLKIGVFCT